MAGACCATVPFLLQPILPAATRPKLRFSAAVSLQSKPTRRKNSLRPKILKTLTKPDPPPESPILLGEEPVPVSSHLETEQGGDVVLGSEQVEQVRVPETKKAAGNFSANSVLKFGLYFVGLYLLQAIVTVLVFGVDEEDSKSKSIGKSKENVLGKSSVSELDNVVHLDESQVAEKIDEIRAMARKARKVEQKELGKSSDDKDEDFSISKNGIGIEKEVGDRLVMLQRRLSSKTGKLPGNFLDMFVDLEDGEKKKKKNVEEESGELMFKKKLKFRTTSAEANRNPKGFPCLGKDDSTRKKSGSGGIDVGDASVGTDDMELLDDKKSEEALEKGTGSFDEGKDMMGAGNVEIQNGTLHRKSRELGKKTRPSSIHKEAKKKVLVDKVSGKQSKNESDPWWLNLPYVLVIFMQRGGNGQTGLFSININSDPQNQSESSYTVAFEDRVDANNFCFVLESCFEDGDDFRANCAPLPKKDLLRAIKSDNMKVFVVKKGQLKLYAGQPFSEVEMALRSLVLQN